MEEDASVGEDFGSEKEIEKFQRYGEISKGNQEIAVGNWGKHRITDANFMYLLEQLELPRKLAARYSFIKGEKLFFARAKSGG